MKYNKIKTDQLVKIYRMRLDGNTWTKISQKTGVGLATAFRAFDRLSEYLSGEKMPNGLPAYKEAVATLRSGQLDLRGRAKSIEHRETQKPTTDPFKRMEQAQQELLESIIDLAKVQVAEQHKKEIQELKDSYEKQLVHYQELLVAAQQSSMIGVVKKRLGLVG